VFVAAPLPIFVGSILVSMLPSLTFASKVVSAILTFVVPTVTVLLLSSVRPDAVTRMLVFVSATMPTNSCEMFSNSTSATEVLATIESLRVVVCPNSSVAVTSSVVGPSETVISATVNVVE
jgi:hypothetical protein